MLAVLQPAFTAIAALGVVLALIWLATRAARLGGLASRSGAGRLLAVEEALAIDQRRQLHLVRCENRRVVLLTGGAQDLVVGWLPEAGSS